MKIMGGYRRCCGVACFVVSILTMVLLLPITRAQERTYVSEGLPMSSGVKIQAMEYQATEAPWREVDQEEGKHAQEKIREIKRYYPNGQLKEVIPFNGPGLWRTYDEVGNMTGAIHFSDNWITKYDKRFEKKYMTLINEARNAKEDFIATTRRHYNSTWDPSFVGEAVAEALVDGSVLVDIKGQLAEYLFYYLADAKEEIAYIPPVRRSGYAEYLNYFMRITPGINCGFYSGDLVNDPFPKFSCRFRISPQGAVTAFLDRTETTSGEAPSYDWVWEKGLRDFFWRTPLKATPAKVHLTKDGKQRFSLTLHDSLAWAVMQALVVERYDDRKFGQQITCVLNDGWHDSVARSALSVEQLRTEHPTCTILFEIKSGQPKTTRLFGYDR